MDHEWLENKKYLEGLGLKPGRGSIVGRTLQEVAAVQVQDIQADPEYELNEIVRIGDYRTMLGVPLMREGIPVGVFVLTRCRVERFTDKQIELVSSFADQAVIAIENTRLFNETKEALERQTATADILKVIASSPSDVQPVFDAIAASSLRLVGGYSTSVLSLDDDMLHLSAFTPTNPSADAALIALFPRPLSGETWNDRIRNGETVEIPDIESDPIVPEGLRATWRKRGLRSLLLVPLVRSQSTIGMINATRKQPGAFAPHHVQLLQTFADQAVIAIENTRLFNDTKEALEHQTATAEVLKVISSSMANPEPVFERIVDSIERLFKCKQIGIFLTPGDGLLHLAAGRGINMEAAAEVYPQPVEQTAAPIVLGAQQQVYYSDVLNDENVPPSLRRAAQAIGNFSDLLTPLSWEDRGVGLMTITREPNASFSDKERSLLRTFADQAVIAIENARLFNEVKAKTADLTESLQQQTATADVLKVISRSAFDLQTVLDTLLASAATLCEAEKGVIFLREDSHFHIESNYGFSAEFEAFARAHPYPADSGSTTTRSAASGVTVHVADVLGDDTQSDLARQYQRLGGHRTIVGVPLRRERETIGVFTLTRQVVQPFTKRQIELVEIFADQAVIAIQNVRLFDQVQARTKELVASLDELRAAQDRLIQTEKLASLGQLTAGIAHEIKNPLNFVNNFSALSAELTDELNDVLKPVAMDGKVRGEVDELTGLLKDNLEKVVQHGKRADSIVKNMLLHSREGSGEHRLADINAIVDESLNLAYHGARAEKPNFNVTMQRSFDPTVGTADVYPQEITRVLLNLISNGFYATAKRKTEAGDGYKPTVTATTMDLGDKIEIRIRDNGNGIPDEVKVKIFNPFFTTKPAGEGTGLGLSMSHDIIVKQHGGKIDVETKPGQFTEFRIELPRTNSFTNKV